MAFSDNSTVFPVYGQAFDFTDWIKSSVTANPLTGGLGNLAILISKDGAASGAAAGTVVSVSGDPGAVNVSLTAADMTAKVIAYVITSDAANAVYATGEIKTCDLSESTTRAGGQTVKKLEQFLRQVTAHLFNRTTINRDTGAYAIYNDADDTALYEGAATDDGTDASRGKLS